MIKLEAISLQRGVKTLLNEASLTINPGEMWGLIGANGSGKSSLFKLLLGELQEDAGSCFIPKAWRIAHMAQEISASDRSALDYVLDGDEELRSIENNIIEAGDNGDALGSYYEALENIDGYTAIARAERLLSGLGFKTGDSDASVNDFSGGWRIRLNLARALMCRSDLLLLDEPTNHLDLDAGLWLESWLQKYPGTLVIISHDRDFLDNVISHTAHLAHSSLEGYTGNYSSFERQRAERMAQQAQAFEKQQERVAEIEDFVRRFRAKASKAKQAQSRIKELERMELIAPAHIDSPFNFKFPTPDKLPQVLITLSQAVVGYTKPIAENIELSVLANSRIGLLGHNGAGKSTLLKSLADEIQLLAGDRVEAAHLKIGYFAQHQLEALDMSASPALHLQRIMATATEQQIRTYLGSFDFQGDRAFEVIEHFSGGEKARLALAIVAWQKPNVLLLDEPTNHLDLEMCQALTMALQRYEGAIVVVSHDRHLLKNTVDDFLLVDKGRVSEFSGDLEDYQAWLAQKRDGDEPKATAEKSKQFDKKESRQDSAAQRQKLKPLRNEVRSLEKNIDKLQAKLATIEGKLADTGIYSDENKAELTKLLMDQGKLSLELEAVEEQWMEKSEELESFSA